MDTADFEEWVLGSNFNLIRSQEDRNKPGVDLLIEMHMFNELISNLDLTNIPFNVRNYTWSNIKLDPFLVNLIGYYAPRVGPSLILLLLSNLSQDPNQITSLMLFTLEALFLNQIYSGLRITELTTQGSLKKVLCNGIILPSMLMLQRTYQLS